MQMRAPNATPGAPSTRGLMPIDEMMDAVEADQTDEDQIDGDDVIEQPRHDQNQNPGKDGNPRREMGTGNNHDFVLCRFGGIGWGKLDEGVKPAKPGCGDNALRRVGF
jgi:hypothetical protein